MKLLLDSCVWGGAKAVLQAAGHDVIWSGDWDEDPGDVEILAFAHREGRVLITIDKDFGDLAIHQGQPHCGMIRIVDFAAREKGTVCKAIVEQYGDDIAAKSIITVNRGRVRIRQTDG